MELVTRKEIITHSRLQLGPWKKRQSRRRMLPLKGPGKSFISSPKFKKQNELVWCFSSCRQLFSAAAHAPWTAVSLVTHSPASRTGRVDSCIPHRPLRPNTYLVPLISTAALWLNRGLHFWALLSCPPSLPKKYISTHTFFSKKNSYITRALNLSKPGALLNMLSGQVV